MEKEKLLAGAGAMAGGMLPIYNQHVMRRNINPASAVTAGLLHAARSEPWGRMEGICALIPTLGSRQCFQDTW